MGSPIEGQSVGSQPGVYGNNSGSGDGVLGGSATGCGVHGVNGRGAYPDTQGFVPPNGSGIYGESDQHEGVFGVSTSGHGVSGLSGAGSGTAPKFGCGVFGDSTNGYGVYGASKTGAGIYGTSGPGHLAGDFLGDVRVTGMHHIFGPSTITGDQTVSGNVSVAGDVHLAGLDCAEQFDLKAFELAEPGTVLIIDEDGALRHCDKPYDRKVAGVVSGAGTFKPGIILGRSADCEGRATVALVGRVYCKVDADAGSIAVGDLLTTSATPGHAMRVTDPLMGFGSVIGKALRSMTSGRGLLPILVALQ